MMHSASPFASDRFAQIVDALCRTVAARITAGVMTGVMIGLIWSRLRRIDVLVQALAAQFRAGTLRADTVRVRDRSPQVSVARSEVTRRPSALPVGFGWLIPLVPYEAACFAGQMRTVLAEPEMVALLAAAPQLGRILRPLCRMLGIEATILARPRAVCGDAAGILGAPGAVGAGDGACDGLVGIPARPENAFPVDGDALDGERLAPVAFLNWGLG